MSDSISDVHPHRLRGGLLCLLLSALAVSVQHGHAAPPARRARPPQFSKSIRDAFFPDAREKLVGTRPEAAASQPVASNAPGAAPVTSAAGPAGKWSQFIAAEAVEDEIKAQQIKLAEVMQNASRFKGGDYQQARVHLSVLAAMLAIVAEYDGRIRWQDEAPALRDMVARAGLNCKVGTDASYKEAKLRSDEVQLLVRGGTLNLDKPAAEVAWPQVAGRSPLMKRLEQAQQECLAPATASQAAFERDAETLLHESQLVAALADIIGREGYEFADDETYLEYAATMRQQALLLRDAVRSGNYEQARSAAGELGKSCTNCHEGYRS